jgi:hypothetical protein
MKTQSIMIASAWLVCLSSICSWASADDQAIIRNKPLDSQRKELDSTVYVTKVNDLDVAEDQTEIEVTAGERTLEVACIVRTFVGMGTVDLGKSTRMNIKLEAGRIYQLNAKLSGEGDCTPILR